MTINNSVTFGLLPREREVLKEAQKYLKNFFDDCIPDDFTVFKNDDCLSIDSRSVIFAIDIIDALTDNHEFDVKRLTVEELYALPNIQLY